ncbi:MAG: hypothetical protein J4N26_00755, partial [Chloroflexi bacterium]|nr:hypothetical protein [Chloroflexota bacterium]
MSDLLRRSGHATAVRSCCQRGPPVPFDTVGRNYYAAVRGDGCSAHGECGEFVKALILAPFDARYLERLRGRLDVA